MNREEIKESFRELLREDFGIGEKERRLILEVVEELDEVKGKKKTNEELAKKCRTAYESIKDKEVFKDFIGILKEENKLGDFSNSVY